MLSLKIVYCSSRCKIGKMNVYSFVSQWNRFELLIATFRLQYLVILLYLLILIMHTASLHQAMRSIVYVSLFVACCQALYLCRVLLFFLASFSLYPGCIYFAALTWNLIDSTVLFSWFKGVFWSQKYTACSYAKC